MVAKKTKKRSAKKKSTKKKVRRIEKSAKKKRVKKKSKRLKVYERNRKISEALKKNQNALGNNGGRPTKYKPEYAEQAYNLWLIGATEGEVATAFKVSIPTIWKWKKDYIEFFNAAKEAKNELDNKVVRSLFQRAMGYSCPDTKVFNDNGEPLIIPITKHYPPDPTSMIFWLKNRQPKDWRDRQEHTGPDGEPLPVVNLTVNGGTIELFDKEEAVDAEIVEKENEGT